MAVEDVQYLIENSVQDSALAFVDSSMRDKAFYPTPASYVVRFDEPYKHVFGIDVLDATIPNTMYNVDLHNNHLFMVFADGANSSVLLDGAAATTDALAALVYQLGFSTDFVAWTQVANATKSANYDTDVMVVEEAPWDAYARTAARVPTLQAQDVAQDVAAAKRDMVMIRRTHCAVPISRAATGSKQRLFEYLGNSYTLPDSSPATALLASGQGFLLVPLDVGGGGYDVVYFEARHLAEPVYSAADPTALTLTDVPCLAVLSLLNVQLEPGNYVISTLATHLNVVMPRRVQAVSTSMADIEKQGVLRLQGSSAADVFMLHTAASTAGEMLGFDEIALAVATGYRAVRIGPSDDPLFMSVLNPASGKQCVDAPGIVNLLGIRYVTLRCPEIEEHINYANKSSQQGTGVGCFKLGSTNELAQVRFDFVSLIRKPFHPIGKLSQLTLSFHRKDGQRYDFKGINHTLLLTIKYYSPNQRVRYTRSLLNPDYDPDFMAYMVRQKRREAGAQDRGYEEENRADADVDAGSDADDDPDGSEHAADDEDYYYGLDFARTAQLDDAQRHSIIMEQRAHELCDDDGCDSSSTESSSNASSLYDDDDGVSPV
jgi:hypothetical protein